LVENSLASAMYSLILSVILFKNYDCKFKEKSLKMEV
jgi:hypothetical protein